MKKECFIENKVIFAFRYILCHHCILKLGAKIRLFIKNMNFLAHLLLTHENEDWMIGNMIADFISNKDLQSLQTGVREGVMVHRHIDTFTDSHEVVKDSIRRLHPIFHKYSPVVIDIYYDYFLARNWRRYSTIPFEDFCEKIYNVFERRMNEMPLEFQPRLKIMMDNDFLQNYVTKSGIQFTFNKFQERVRFPVSFAQASDVMMVYEEEFNEEFNVFFPEIIGYLKKM